MPGDMSQTQIFRDNIKRLTGTELTYVFCPINCRLLPTLSIIAPRSPLFLTIVACQISNSSALGHRLWAMGYGLWATNISEIAKRQNVIVKISGVIAYADPDIWALQDLRPYFDHTVLAFGHQRIMWGNDSPVCNLGGGLETWVAATHASTNTWSETERSLF